MYNKILVPLDGSQFAQCALDHVRTISKGCHVSEIILFRVVEPVAAKDLAPLAQARGNLYSQVENAIKAEASDYIRDMTRRLKEEGLSVRGETAEGKADEEIIDYAKKNRIDLIIMSSHGKSGLSRWTLGSIADRVIHYSTVPVLLVATPGCRIAQGM
jgi:nucleotide-binding universal stress UspA family protein